jgi:hypothetical protein
MPDLAEGAKQKPSRSFCDFQPSTKAMKAKVGNHRRRKHAFRFGGPAVLLSLRYDFCNAKLLPELHGTA